MYKRTYGLRTLQWALPLVSAAAMAQHVPPPEDAQRFDVRYQAPDVATVIRTSSAPEMDGSYDRLWDRVHIYPLTRIIAGSSNEESGSQVQKNDLIAGFQAVHDGEYLFLYVRVIDDAPRLNTTAGDHVIVELGREGSSPTLAFRIGAELEQTTGDDVPVNFAIGPAPVQGDPSWPPHSGYTAALSVPLSALGVAGNDGDAVALNVHVADVDDEARVETVWRWASAMMPGGTEHGPMGRAEFEDSFVAGSNDDFLPRQVWLEKEGVVVVEAELIDHHSNWVFMSTPEGYTGTGYLSWQGADRTLPAPPFLRRSNDDYSNERLGPQQEWLIVRVLIRNAGTYSLDLRNVHYLEDGDNDVWFGEIGQRFGLQRPITRMGDNLRSGTIFSWLDWGVQELELNKGQHAFFIGGRSVNFGVDRIVLYRKDDDEANEIALNPESPPSSLCQQC